MQHYAYNKRERMMSDKHVLLEQDSITCKLYNTRFDSLGDMRHHVLIDHIQKGEYQVHLVRKYK